MNNCKKNILIINQRIEISVSMIIALESALNDFFTLIGFMCLYLTYYVQFLLNLHLVENTHCYTVAVFLQISLFSNRKLSQEINVVFDYFCLYSKVTHFVYSTLIVFRRKCCVSVCRSEIHFKKFDVLLTLFILWRPWRFKRCLKAASSFF